MPRSAPARPRWRLLYGTFLVVVFLGLAAHALLPAGAIPSIDAVSAVAMLLVLTAWTHINRVAISRLDEPDVGDDAPSVRIVRSRARHEPEIGAGGSDEVDGRVLLLYDFR